MLKPAILARDPDLIKDIMITNFNSFRDNDIVLSKKHDPLIASNPFFTRDEEWRDGRKMIIPAFSQNKVINFGIFSVCQICFFLRLFSNQ